MTLSDYLAQPGESAVRLARQCGVAPSTISRVARGLIQPKLSLVAAIVRATDGAVPVEAVIEACVEREQPAPEAV